jgi:hypothetical protein
MKKQKSYEIAYDIVVDNLRKISFSELLDKIKYSGGNILSLNMEKETVKFNILFMEKEYAINFPEFTFTSKQEKIISLVTKIIILHYIEKTDPFLKLTGELVSYKHIPGAFNYYPVFQKKAILPILSKNIDIQRLQKVCKILNGIKIDLGDFSFKIKIFPKIDITVIFWSGDEDFDSSLDFLFDKAIEHMLSLEDIVVVSQMLSKRILFILDNEG